MVKGNNEAEERKKEHWRTAMTSEKKRENLTIDPGSLMVAMYILSVSALVLLGWFGSAGAGCEQPAVRSAVEFSRQ